MSTTTAIKNACESLEVEVRSYSGRGMYGRKCIGFVVPRGKSAATFAFELCAELLGDDEFGPEAVEELRGHEWCQDSMGMDTIVYVPGVTWDDEEGEEDEDGDDS